MNKLIVGAVGVLFSAATAAQSVTESRVWTETFPVSGPEPALRISNIWGTVRVRRGPDGIITITVDETRSAPDQERFDRSLELLSLDIQSSADELSIVVGEQARHWRHGDPCRDCRADLQFDVMVPKGTKLDLGTVLDGVIDVSGVVGTVSARNVNGPVRAYELGNCEALESVNGKLDVSFEKSPASDCAIETINGDITLVLPGGSGLDVALDQFNGRVESEFAVSPLALPATVEQSSDNGGTSYRIRQSAGFRLEQGGPMFSISSLNGDVRIRKNQ